MDIFDLENLEEEQLTELTQKEFVDKTRTILGKIYDSYSQCYFTRQLKDEDYTELCDTCPGECISTSGDRCYPDREYGECFTRSFDSDMFKGLIEDIIFHDNENKIDELMSCNIINE